MTVGSRKLIVALSALLIAAIVPLTQTQADVILGVIYAMMGANTLEHIGGAIGKARVRPDGSGGSDSRASGDEE
jgi:cytochrome c biogenesis protein CcdA